MRSDYLPNDLKRVWKELEANPAPPTPEDLRREAGRLRGGVRFRNWFAAGVASFVAVGYFMFLLVFKTPLERVGAVLAIAGAVNVIYQFLKRPARAVPDLGATDSIHFYRSELERQRDFHRGKGVFSWLLPILPGPLIWNIGFAIAHPFVALFVKVELTAFLLIAAVVVPLNLRMARRIQRRIDALEPSQNRGV